MKKRWKQKVLAAVVSLSMVGTLMPQNPFGVVWERTVEAAVTSDGYGLVYFNDFENSTTKSVEKGASMLGKIICFCQKMS